MFVFKFVAHWIKSKRRQWLIPGNLNKPDVYSDYKCGLVVTFSWSIHVGSKIPGTMIVVACKERDDTLQKRVIGAKVLLGMHGE